MARFIEGLRQANGIIAGITKMRWLRFAAYNTLGAFLWVGVWITVGYVAGSHIDAVYTTISRYLIYVVIAILVLTAAQIGRHLWRRRHAKAGTPASTLSEAEIISNDNNGQQGQPSS